MRMTFQNKYFSGQRLWIQPLTIAACLMGFMPVMMMASIAVADRPMAAGDYIVGLSSAFESVHELPDFGAFVSVRYSPRIDAYVFTYTSDAGIQKKVAINAQTGQEFHFLSKTPSTLIR